MLKNPTSLLASALFMIALWPLACDCGTPGAVGAACENNDQCDDGLACVDGKCAAVAGEGEGEGGEGEGGEGEGEGEGCTSDADCTAPLVCDVGSGNCVDGGGNCTTNSDCFGDQVCNDGTCVDGGGGCASDADCLGD